MRNDTVIITCICGELVGCAINKFIMSCHNCPGCIVCCTHADLGEPTGSYLCQRCLQDAMDERREYEQTPQKTKEQRR